MLTCVQSPKKIFHNLLLFLLLPAFAVAQQPTVRGNVSDDQKHVPVAGVSVQLKGTTTGTTTDENGNYSLALPNLNGVLVFSYIGYTAQEVAIENRQIVNVGLRTSSTQLDDVVVVGYGTQRRKDVTGSVVSIDKQRLENLPNTNLAQALAGSLPGVSINTNAGGAEGNNVTILIRGRKSINGNVGPLIVLDGVPYRGSISDINPSDIASIDILKDASALAIYGAESANGVILVTTKKGVAGKPVISYDGFWGVQEYANLPPVLMGEDFYNYKITRERGSITPSEQAVYDSKNFTNWLDLATRTGQRQQHTVSVRGGGNNFKYYSSVTLLDIQGIALNDNFKRLTTRFNFEANITNWFTYGSNTQLSYNDRSGLAPDFSGNEGVYTFNPLTVPYDSLGKLKVYPWPEDQFFGNPLAPTLAKNVDNTYKIWTNNYFNVKIPFIKGLSYRLNTGIEYQGRKTATYYGRDTRTGEQARGRLTNNNSINRTYLIENILNYERSFGKHTVGFTGLYSYEDGKNTSNSTTGEGYPSDVLTIYGGTAALLDANNTLSSEAKISQMGRLNYNYDSRYLITFTGRNDGFSGFGENNKYAFFPSAAIGWNISNESFFANNKIFDNLKLRLSYGSNGNTLSPYQTLARMGERLYVDAANTAAGYIPTTFASPNLHWETTTTANIGLDFSVLKRRLSGSIDVYDGKTTDLLLNRLVSPVQGIDQITQNIGQTGNRGFELLLNSTNFEKKDFNWTTQLNVSVNRNRIIDLYGNGLSDTANSWFIGYPINVRFGYVYDGVWQLGDDTAKTPQGAVRPGYVKVRDMNGDSVINGFDRTIIGKEEPSFIWGMSNTFRYKNFSLYVFVHGVAGRREANTLLSDNNVGSGVRFTTVVKNWWTRDNPTNDFYGNMIGATQGRVVIPEESSSFVRIKDVTLSYDFDQKLLGRAKISKAKVYIQARNLFTITKWSGLDPEFSSQQTIPLQREYLVGLNFSF